MILIKNIGQLVTPADSNKKSGKEMGELKVYTDVDILIDGDTISKIGKNIDADVTEVIDAKGMLVTPGYIDSHTHLVFGGYREDEYKMRLEGRSYVEIMNAGGGISASVNKTRAASFDDMYSTGLKRLDMMASLGVTTVEVKSGYGLDFDTEIRQLEVINKINKDHPLDVVSTFLGPHSIPKEYKGRDREYIDFVVKDVLPYVKEKKLSEFVDIFTEKGVFNNEDSKVYLEAAKEMGFKLKMHADELYQTDASVLAGEMGCKSADHLLKISDKGIAALKEGGTVATLLPLTAFSIKEEYAPARKLIESGVPVALATDYNPGSCHSMSVPLMVALATNYMSMSIEEVINALTINAAHAVDRSLSVGSIEVGKKADILIHSVENIDFLPYLFGINTVNKVIKNGKLIIDKDGEYVYRK